MVDSQVSVGKTVPTLTRADLAQLKAIRDDLEAQIDSGTDNCLLDRTFVAFFDGR